MGLGTLLIRQFLSGEGVTIFSIISDQICLSQTPFFFSSEKVIRQAGAELCQAQVKLQMVYTGVSWGQVLT